MGGAISPVLSNPIIMSRALPIAWGALMRGNGIIIPDTAKEKPQEGEIVAVGNGARDDSGKLSRSTSRLATAFCSANGPAPKSRSTVKTC
jgi:hypothetical protein